MWPFKWNFTKRKIFEQIEEYVKWREQPYPGMAHSDREYLIQFAKGSHCNDVSEISEADVLEFWRKCAVLRFELLRAQTSIRNFLRYYKSLGYPLMIQKISGLCYDKENKSMPIPYTDLKMVGEVTRLKADGLSFSAISKKLNKDRKTIIRWYQCGTGKRKVRLNRLSTEKQFEYLTSGK